jgi:hypothetical protein
MKHPPRVNRLALATLVLLGLASFGQTTSPATAAITEAEALAAARHGAQWIVSLQELDGELGSFGGDWSMSALAAVGINAADVRIAPSKPSAQDFYLSLWTGEGPGGAATDYERAILAGYAGGLEPSRLDAHTNLLADLAAQFDGHELGGPGSTNADAFGVLALDAAGMPSDVIEALAQSLREQQDTDGGWNFAAGAKSSEVDMTGAVVAALCTAGATPQDPALTQAFTYLHAAQSAASGGFVSSSGSLGLNTDTTSWVVSGLRACGIDPESWVTAQSKTPLDFLLSQQNPDGSFQRRAGDEEEDLYATQDAVRALAGATFTAPPPPRAESSQPAIRPAPSVAAGTPVPMTLVIDSGGEVTGGSSIRMCKVIAPLGTTVAQLLEDAEEASSPSYCLSDLALDGGRIARLNGVSAAPGKSAWEIRREGGEPETDTGGTLGLGALVQAQLVPSGEMPAVSPLVPATTSIATTSSPGTHTARGVPARLRVLVGPLTRVSHGRVTVKLNCPRGASATGCSGLVRVRVALRARHGGPVRQRVVGERKAHLATGASGTVTIALNHMILQALRAHDDRLAWMVATTRDPSTGLDTSSSASTVLR